MRVETRIRIFSGSNELKRNRFLIFDEYFCPTKSKMIKMSLNFKESAI